MPSIETEPETDGDAAVTDGTPKKRTRRGTRGGRNRKRKPAPVNGDGSPAPLDDAEAAGENDDAIEDHVAAEPELELEPEPRRDEPEAGEGDGYVPMSEWIGDFDRRP